MIVCKTVRLHTVQLCGNIAQTCAFPAFAAFKWPRPPYCIALAHFRLCLVGRRKAGLFSKEVAQGHDHCNFRPQLGALEGSPQGKQILYNAKIQRQAKVQVSKLKISRDCFLRTRLF